MKRAIKGSLVLITAGIVAAGAWYGPQLWAGYQFMKAVDQQTTEYRANGGPWPQLQDTCVLCHGENGRARNALYPELAGLSSSYIEEQLQAFAEGRRKSPPMKSISLRLNDQQIQMLAAYYEDQAPQPTGSVTTNAVLSDQGQQAINDMGCTSCHGVQLDGGPAAPRLAGQSEIYMAEQLKAFRDGDREDPGQSMNAIARQLSEADIKAVAHYLANKQSRGAGAP